MQKDFHYYATYCAAWLAGYSHEESMQICYSAQLVDWCSKTLLKKLKAPKAAATTQLQLELMETGSDPVSLQDVTRIWASFHFLPRNLYAKDKHSSRAYRDKYRLICGPNSDLLLDTVELARGGSLQAVGIAMHILADTWAHRNFAGTPSLVINNTDFYFYEIMPDGSERPVVFRHNPNAPDDPEKGIYTNSLYQSSENSIMNLGHGRAGHLPDYSFITYRYLPAWGNYEDNVKDNPTEYYKAFCQMIHAMRYLRGDVETFQKQTYAYETAAPWKQEIQAILTKRQLDACADWKAFGETLSGREIEDFDLQKYQGAYLEARPEEKNRTFLGAFFLAAMAQKSMVTNKIFRSGSLLAGFSVDFSEKGLKGIKDYHKLVEFARERYEK